MHLLWIPLQGGCPIAAGRRRPAARDCRSDDVPDSYDEALVSATHGRRSEGHRDRGGASDRCAPRMADCAPGRPEGPAITLRSTERVVEQFGLVKDASEVVTLREAARAADRLSPMTAFGAVRGGVTERDGRRRDRSGAQTRPATSVRRSTRSSRPGRIRRCRTTGPATGCLHAGDLVVLDFGGVLDGYCSDLTRTVSVGHAVT